MKILDGNDIGHDGTESLSAALLQNSTLKRLSLRRNSLLADAAQVLIIFCCQYTAVEVLMFG